MKYREKKWKQETTERVYGLCMCAGLQWWSRAVCTGWGVWLQHRHLHTKVQPGGDELPDLFPTPELLTFRKRSLEQIQSLCWLFGKEVLNRYKVYVDFLEEKFWTDTKFMLTFWKRSFEQIQSLCWLFGREVLNRYKVCVDFLEEKFWTDTKFVAFSTKAMEIQLLSSFV